MTIVAPSETGIPMAPMSPACIEPQAAVMKPALTVAPAA
jgi:hypothetical protein